MSEETYERVELAQEEIHVRLPLPSFDRACGDAMEESNFIFGIDEYGHSLNVEDWIRSRCWVEIEFVGYLGVCHDRHNYTFKGRVFRNYEGEEEDYFKRVLVEMGVPVKEVLRGKGITTEENWMRVNSKRFGWFTITTSETMCPDWRAKICNLLESYEIE